jgi:type I restriction enzyme S subunit
MVEWKKLVSVSDVLYGYPFESSLFSEDSDNMPLIRIRDVKPAKASTYYSGEPIEIYRIKKGDILVGMDGEFNIGKWNDRDGLLNQRVLKLKGKVGFCVDGFLYHYMGPIFKQIEKETAGGSVKHLSAKEINKILIPVPSLAEQQRIVGILDTFTASIDNLKKQIAQRRKQYEYYRDQLLDLEGKPGVEMKTLGDIGEFIRGNGIQKSDFVDEGFGCIHYGQIHARYGFSASETISKIERPLYKKCKKAKMGDVVLATTSEDSEGVAKPFVWLGEDEVAVSGDAFIYHHNQIGKFIGHQFLTQKFMQFKVKYATGAKVVRISGENMAKFRVALPSLQEQSRIVGILDTFEASIQNLEAQLKEREKQYEYYRNKLLTFE